MTNLYPCLNCYIITCRCRTHLQDLASDNDVSNEDCCIIHQEALSHENLSMTQYVYLPNVFWLRKEIQRLLVFKHPSSDWTYHVIVMPIRQGFPHFSHTCYDILSWDFVYDCFDELHSKIECCHFVSIFVWFMNLQYLKYSFVHFSCTYFEIELKFYIWLCFETPFL